MRRIPFRGAEEACHTQETASRMDGVEASDELGHGVETQVHEKEICEMQPLICGRPTRLALPVVLDRITI